MNPESTEPEAVAEPAVLPEDPQQPAEPGDEALDEVIRELEDCLPVEPESDVPSAEPETGPAGETVASDDASSSEVPDIEAAAQEAAEEAPPQPAQDADAAREFEIPDARPRVARPLLIAYATTWVALAGAAYVLLSAAEYPPSAPEYRYIAFATVALVCAAPLVWLTTWLLSRRGAEERHGLGLRSMVWTSAIAAAGTLACLGVLTVLDALRLGWM